MAVSETDCSGNTYPLAAGMLPDWLFLVLSPINISDTSVVHSGGRRSEPYLDAGIRLLINTLLLPRQSFRSNQNIGRLIFQEELSELNFFHPLSYPSSFE
ncbi:hypothetical protein OROHE_002793 [Orobanche hederae]